MNSRASAVALALVALSPISAGQQSTESSWFATTNLDIGELNHLHTRTAEFPFANPTGLRQQLRNFVMSIQCQKLEIELGKRRFELTRRPVADSLYEIEQRDGETLRRRVSAFYVAPKQRGRIRVVWQGWGIPGRRDASVSFSTTDPGMPIAILKVQTTVTRHFRVTPETVDFGTVMWDEQRPFRALVETLDRSRFALGDHGPLPDFIRITSKRRIRLPDGSRAWQVDGRFGPNANPARFEDSEIYFDTDHNGQRVRLGLRAKIATGITFSPAKEFRFGDVPKNGASKSVRIRPPAGSKIGFVKSRFAATSLPAEFLRTRHAKVGRDLIITVEILPNARLPKSQDALYGRLVVRLTHPRMQALPLHISGTIGR